MYNSVVFESEAIEQAERMSLAYERDSRRYDAGFETEMEVAG